MSGGAYERAHIVGPHFIFGNFSVLSSKLSSKEGEEGRDIRFKVIARTLSRTVCDSVNRKRRKSR